MRTRRLVLSAAVLVALGLTALVAVDSLHDDDLTGPPSPRPSIAGDDSPEVPFVPLVDDRAPGPAPEDEPDPEPRRRPIGGRVVTDDGRPVPDVMVICVPDGKDEREVRVTARTDAHGRWEVLVPAGGRYRVQVQGKLAGGAPARVSRGALTYPGRTSVEVTVEEAGVFRGRVLDPDGRPVAGARVEAWSSLTAGGKPHRTVETGSDGTFRVLLSRAGTANLKAYVPTTLDVGLPFCRAYTRGVKPDEPVDLKMTKGAEIRGRITWWKGGSAAGIPLRARQSAGSHPMVVRALTDATGEFRIGGLFSTLNYTLSIDEDRDKGSTMELLGTKVVKAGATGVELQVTATVAATGTLYRAGGKPAGRWSFWVVHEESGSKLGCRTRKDGTFLLNAPELGTYTAWTNIYGRRGKQTLKLGAFHGGASGVVLQIPEP